MTWQFPIELKVLGTTSDSDSYKDINLKTEVEIPTLPHCGAYSVFRTHDRHEGVDLYCPNDTPVYAVEDGIVVMMRCFTGRYAHCAWWNETDSISIEGATGVVEYGEIITDEEMQIRRQVFQGDLIGWVRTVLKKDKGRPMSMLHMNLYEGAQTRDQSWSLEGPKPTGLADPTPHLIQSWKEGNK